MTAIPPTYGRPERPRRPRPLLLGVAAAAALLAVLAWTRYDPLARGDLSRCPAEAAMVPAGEIDEQTGSEPVVCTVVNVDAEAVAFATTVRNDGILPVQVRAVRLEGEIEGVLRVSEVLMGLREGADVSTREMTAFAPFRLQPGHQRLIEVRGSLPPCTEVSRARVATFTSLPLRTAVLGLPRDSNAGLDPPVRLIAETC